MNIFIKNNKQTSNIQITFGIAFLFLIIFVYRFFSFENNDFINPIPFYIFASLLIFLSVFFIVQGLYTRYFFGKKMTKYLSREKQNVKKIDVKYQDMSNNSSLQKLIGMQKICVNITLLKSGNLYFLFNPSEIFEVINFLIENFSWQIINMDKCIYQLNTDFRKTNNLRISPESV